MASPRILLQRIQPRVSSSMAMASTQGSRLLSSMSARATARPSALNRTLRPLRATLLSPFPVSSSSNSSAMFQNSPLRPICRPLSSPVAAVAAPAASPLQEAPSEKVALELGFELLGQQFIEEYQANALLYRHKKTGAEIMSVIADDENKVFGAVLRTPVNDSTGIPHILEHSVLCGSRKYQVKEPFVELLKGSLQTFLNAFTYPDRTCYPVASTNLQDFYNLVDVYLDAVFFPNCVRDEQTFQQEGWHYELEEPSEPITFKGVVFNEMKGVYSQPDSVLARACQQALFPANTYGKDSGGDPTIIPDLTFQQFQDFHALFYHPSNARLWFYGDDDPTERLRLLASYLDQFEASPTSAQKSQITPQPLLESPRSLSLPYAASESGNQKDMVSVNWVLGEGPLPPDQDLAVQFLDFLLLGTPAAPLNKVLMESGLGEALVGGGLSDELLQPTFSVGLKGVDPSRVSEVEPLVLNTLRQVQKDGFSSSAVEAAVNSIEFALRENNTGSFPRGLNLMLRCVGKWIYEKDPFEALTFQQALDGLKDRLAKEGPEAVFSPLLSSLLLDNPHRVTVHLKPDTSLAQQMEEEERRRLEGVKASLEEAQLEALVSATEALKDKQETPDSPEALKCVPTLALEDIPRKASTVPRLVSEQQGATVLRHDLVTNDILYAELAFDLTRLPSSLVPLVPLFCQSLQEMGTADMDFVALSELIGRRTGGISVYPLTSARRGSAMPSSFLMVRGKSTSAQAPYLLDLMRVLLQDVKLSDQSRFRQFVSQSKQRMESRLSGGGHSIAASRLDAMDNVAGWVGENMGGLSYLDHLKALEQQVDSNWPSVQAKLESIRTALLGRQGAVVNLTGDSKALSAAEGPLSQLLQALPEQTPNGELNPEPWTLTLPRQNEGLVIPTQVNYVGKAGNLYSAGYKLKGSAYVISKHLGTTWLWDRVRVSGGAYGGFCDFDSHSGVFTYLSYRDPNLLETLDNYDGTVDFLRSLEIEGDSLSKAIIGTIGDVDSYQLPDAKGHSSMLRYLLGITDEERQQRREEILSTTAKDFHEFAEVLEAVRKDGTVVVVGSADDVAEANKQRADFLNVRNVL